MGKAGSHAGSLTLNGVQFISNTAGQQGGALFALQPVTVSASLFEDNRCGGANCLGGGIYVSDTLTVTGTQFLSNTATAGGAVYALSGGSLHWSCVVGNQLAGVTNVTHTLDATNDFWGAADGPTPIGHGDTISGTVTASPFLTAPIFACPFLTLGRKLYLTVIVR